MKCQIELILLAIISLRGLGNESLIEETGFVSKVNELEIDSSEKLERLMSYQLHKLFTLMLHHFLLIFVPILELFHM